MSLRVQVRNLGGVPAMFVNGRPHSGMMWFGRPNAAADFAAAGVHFCTFVLGATEAWWVGPDRYDFQSFDRLVDEFIRADPDIRLMPRIHLGYHDLSWWAQRHPEELSAARDLNGRPVDYFQRANNDIGCPFSFASRRFQRDASAALSALVAHCEERDDGERFFGYHLAGGISNEWFEWWTYLDGCVGDYSPPATRAFRQWLRRRYRHSLAALRRAWRQPRITFDSAEVPPPLMLGPPRTGAGSEPPRRRRESADRLRALRDPVREQPAIDYYAFLGEAAANLQDALCGAIRRACRSPRLVGVFHGYFFPHWNNLSPARHGHAGFRRLLASRNVDFIVAPYHYDHRGLDGVHFSQSLPVAVHAAGKLFIDEIDTFTHLTRWPWNSLRTMRHARTPEESARVLRRDAGHVLARGGGAWWMDLLHQRWHGDRRIVETIAAARRASERLLGGAGVRAAPSRRGVSQIALVVSDAASLYTRPGSDLAYHLLSAFRQFELSRIGAPFDEILIGDLLRPDAPEYRLCIFPNLFCLDDRTARGVERYLQRNGRWALWFYAPGVFRDSGPTRAGAAFDLDQAARLTGIRLAVDSRPGRLRVRIRRGSTLGGIGPALRHDIEYGMPQVESRQRQSVVCPHPLGWQQRAGPIFHVRPDDAVTPIGWLAGTSRIGLALRRDRRCTSVFSAAPCLPAPVLRAFAAAAGVHLWSPLGTVVCANAGFVSVKSERAGPCELRLPSGVSAECVSGHAWRAANGAGTVTLRDHDTAWLMTTMHRG